MTTTRARARDAGSSPAVGTMAVVFAAGLVLRLPGLFVNGMADVFEFILDWGADVHALGLAHGFTVNYGVLSYALFGVAEWLGELIPRFWWLPYKGIAVLFEAGVFVALLRVAPARARLWVAVAYWLNPWFIWHGAYQGFWEGPHVLFALLASLMLALRGDVAPRWALAGVLLFVSWQFKPQGLIHFALPVGLLLAIWGWRHQRAPLVRYAAGLIGAAAAVSIAVWLAGGSIVALVDNVRSSGQAQVRLSSGALGFWRFVSFLYMQAHGLPGEVWTLRLPVPWLVAGIACGFGVSLAILVWFVSRIAWAPSARLTPTAVYLTMVMGALVMSQFAPLAHINHGYGAMVLLIPLLPAHRRLRLAWMASVVVQGLAHASRYLMGTTLLLPPEHVLARYGHATALADQVRALPAATTPDAVLRAQQTINDALGVLPGHQAISVLGLVVLAATVVMLAALFELARSRPRDLLALPD